MVDLRHVDDVRPGPLGGGRSGGAFERDPVVSADTRIDRQVASDGLAVFGVDELGLEAGFDLDAVEALQ